ncbi:MAG: nucleotidyltransferase domain-containing protein [Euryarchaeota archaeon]|nr:nucleotidyltransferase domain-containing protein [Euryarchaeota archaeon]
MVSYYHPKDRIISFLRYYPYTYGDRELNGQRYSKVESTENSFDYLRSNFPKYIFQCDMTLSKLQAAPLEKIEKVYHPNEKLKELFNTIRDPLQQKTIGIATFFNNTVGIPLEKLGISGSLLIDLHSPSSDLDFVIYGLDNFEKARKALAEILYKERQTLFRRPKLLEWIKIYKKRKIDPYIYSLKEFIWHEQRKFNRGIFNEASFDILAVRDWSEIKGRYGDKKFERLGKIKIRAKIASSKFAFDYPATYQIAEAEVLNGPKIELKEIASYTHTFVGQAYKDEIVEANGILERVYEKDKIKYYRIIVGTTREANDEYLKVISQKTNFNSGFLH